jgi:hypothetical protein
VRSRSRVTDLICGASPKEPRCGLRHSETGSTKPVHFAPRHPIALANLSYYVRLAVLAVGHSLDVYVLDSEGDPVSDKRVKLHIKGFLERRRS